MVRVVKHWNWLPIRMVTSSHKKSLSSGWKIVIRDALGWCYIKQGLDEMAFMAPSFSMNLWSKNCKIFTAFPLKETEEDMVCVYLCLCLFNLFYISASTQRRYFIKAYLFSHITFPPYFWWQIYSSSWQNEDTIKPLKNWSWHWAISE